MYRLGINIAAVKLLWLLTLGIASAQQLPDPAFLSKAITRLQQQRNDALDAAASAEAREVILKEEVTKLKVRVQELEKTATPSKEPEAR